tara:strand:- start:872 stop:1468 length:597 start_codon:yes stop_codon:yes gene_type:complete
MKRGAIRLQTASPSAGTAIQQRKHDKRKAAENAKSATSEKLDWLDALCMDPRLRPSDFKVAVKLMQFRNARTGLCNPSYQTLADETCLKSATVRVCVKKLCDSGWIEVKRPNYPKPNFYQFIHVHVNPKLDRRIMLREVWADLRKERAEKTALATFDRDEDNGPLLLDRDENNARDREPHHGKHVSDHVGLLALSKSP